MPFVIKQDDQFKRELLPAGNHHAVCYGVIDLGTQNGEYMGTPKKTHEVMVCWEIPALTIEIEKDGVKKIMPRVKSRRFTLSLGEKANLYKMLVSWRGRAFTTEELAGFDVFNLIGANCLLNIIHVVKGENTYDNITGASPILAGMTKLKPKTDIWQYYIPEDQMKIPEVIPDWIKEIIGKSDEHQFVNNAQAHFNSQADDTPPEYDSDSQPDDDIPF